MEKSSSVSVVPVLVAFTRQASPNVIASCFIFELFLPTSSSAWLIIRKLPPVRRTHGLRGGRPSSIWVIQELGSVCIFWWFSKYAISVKFLLGISGLQIQVQVTRQEAGSKLHLCSCLPVSRPARVSAFLRFCFLGAFSKSRKATVSFVMSVCPSAWDNSVPTGHVFMQLDVSNFRKSVDTVKVSLNLTRITSTLHEYLCTFMIVSRLILLRMMNVSGKSCGAKKIVPFMRVWKNIWCSRTGHRLRYNTDH